MNDSAFTPQTVSVEFKGEALPLFGRGLLMVVSQFLVIPLPWAAAAFYRWIIGNLSLSDGTQVSFRGKAEEVWGAFMLIGLLCWVSFVPFPLVPFLVMFAAAGLWIVVLRWIVRSMSLSCGTALSFEGTYWQYIGWSLLVAISVFTIIGWAWAGAAMTRWLCRSVKGGGHVTEFVGSGGAILWRALVTGLCCVFIIPIPWITLWLFKWFVEQVRIRKAVA